MPTSSAVDFRQPDGATPSAIWMAGTLSQPPPEIGAIRTNPPCAATHVETDRIEYRIPRSDDGLVLTYSRAYCSIPTDDDGPSRRKVFAISSPPTIRDWIRST